MSYIRRLPSGKWQATVRGPDGRKHTKTDPLKRVVRTWATSTESSFGHGDVRDPRAGDIKVGDWHKRYAAASGVQAITAAKNASLWSVHCEPKWSGWRMNAVTRMEAQGWVGDLRATHRARHLGRPAEGDGVPLLSAATIANGSPTWSCRSSSRVRLSSTSRMRRLRCTRPRESSARSGRRWSSWACRWGCGRVKSTGCTVTALTGCAAALRSLT